MPQKEYDVDLLRRLWLEGVYIDEIVEQIGCNKYHVYELCKKHGIPKRGRTPKPKYVDPTPEEIEERAAYCRLMRELGTPIGGV